MSHLASRNKAPIILVATLVVAGMALRLFPLLGDPLHQDEALYGFWGRLVSTGRDPWLATVPVDKPPLVPFLIAGSQVAFGVSAFALRLPGMAASLISIALTYALARRLYSHRSVALVAAGVMALTPYPVLFGATAFTDPILVAWWLAACYAALAGGWGWAGLLLGLAFASKQQAIVLAPLIVGLGLIGWQQGRRKRSWQVVNARFVLALALVLCIVFAWDEIRIAAGATSGFWDQGIESYGGLRLIRSTELQPRLRAWAGLGGHLFGWSWLGLFAMAGVGWLLWFDVNRQRETRAAVADVVLITFSLFYLFLHALLAFPVWDRYLLPLVPLAGLLAGRTVTLVGEAIGPVIGQRRERHRALRLAFFVLVAAALLGSGLVATAGRIPVGGDHGAYDGLEEVVGYLRTLPVGTVLYDRWLSWHYDYYLFDAYLYRAGFPSPQWLAADAAAFFDGRPRYLVLPSWESSARLRRAVSQVGLAMSPVLTTRRRDGTTSFVVYEIGRGFGEGR